MTGTASGPVDPEPHTATKPHGAFATALPPVNAHVGYITVQGTERTSLRKPIADANGDSPGKRGHWKVVGGPGRRPHTYPPHPGHPLAPEGKTRSRRDTLAHRHARARHGHARARNRHARAPHLHAVLGPQAPETKSRSESGPRNVHNPLDANHAPSGWLVDRGTGLGTRPVPWCPDVALRTPPAVSINRGGVR